MRVQLEEKLLSYGTLWLDLVRSCLLVAPFTKRHRSTSASRFLLAYVELSWLPVVTTVASLPLGPKIRRYKFRQDRIPRHPGLLDRFGVGRWPEATIRQILTELL